MPRYGNNSIIGNTSSDSGVHRFGEAIDLDFETDSTYGTTAAVVAEGIAMSNSTIFPDQVIFGDGFSETGINVNVGDWTYDNSSPDQGWKLDVLTHKGGAFLWPLERQTGWECIVNYYLPTLISSDADPMVGIVATTPGCRPATMAFSYSDAGLGQRYQARTGHDVESGTDISDSGNVFRAKGGTGATGTDFQIGMRSYNGALFIYDQAILGWGSAQNMEDINHTFAYCGVVVALQRGTTYQSPSIQRIRFRYIDMA